jgi:carbon storage regulator
VLVLSRKKHEQVKIGDDIIVTVVDIRGDKIRLGFEAPKNVRINRKEIAELIAKEANA